MWAMVFFDLPVMTKPQRTAANRYRNELLSSGFERLQLSVYAKFAPTIQRAKREGEDAIKALPPEGSCRVLYLTDHQWQRMLVIEHKKTVDPESAPSQLAIFSDAEDSEVAGNIHIPETSEV